MFSENSYLTERAAVKIASVLYKMKFPLYISRTICYNIPIFYNAMEEKYAREKILFDSLMPFQHRIHTRWERGPRRKRT